MGHGSPVELTSSPSLATTLLNNVLPLLWETKLVSLLPCRSPPFASMWTASKSTVQTLPLVPVDLHGEGRFTHIGELRARTNRTIAAARPTATRMQLSIMGACTSAATATKPALTRTRRSTKSSFLWCGLRLKLPPGVFARTQTLVDVS